MTDWGYVSINGYIFAVTDLSISKGQIRLSLVREGETHIANGDRIDWFDPHGNLNLSTVFHCDPPVFDAEMARIRLNYVLVLPTRRDVNVNG